MVVYEMIVFWKKSSYIVKCDWFAMEDFGLTLLNKYGEYT